MSKMTDSYESLLNGRLAQLLVELGLNALAEQAVESGRMNVRIKFNPHIVAIECEKYGIGKRTAAVRDAIKRLIPPDDYGQPDADIAVALVYSHNCTESNFTVDTEVEFAIIDPVEIDDQTADQIAKQTQWNVSAVKILATTVKRLNDDLGNPDFTAAKLNSALEFAVNRLSVYQRQQLANSLNLPLDPNDRNFHAAAKRSMLVVASAAMFHARLNSYIARMKPLLDSRTAKPFEGDWPPLSLQQCLKSHDLIGELREAWNLILAVDYKPIFETGLAAIGGVTHDPNLSAAIRRVISSSLAIVRVIEGLRHDLLGRIFHAVLNNARYDGSFYTTTAAATLLSGLAIRDRDDLADSLSNMRVIDPSCGTGTLLMAVAERIKDVAADIKYAELIEHVLTGYDINLTATHMAATTLGLLSPTTKFNTINIYLAAFGETENSQHPVKTGSLEIYGEDQVLPTFDWPGSMTQFESGVTHQLVEKADLVIMNPPFTRNSLRHNQLGKKVKNLVKSREKEIFSKAPVQVSFTSSGPAFLVLAEFLAKAKNSTLALVLPLVASRNPSTQEVRRFLASRFHVETVITPHDPTRFWFSENTSISEMLVIMRRREEKGPTRFINLSRNPKTVHEALNLAENINKQQLDRIPGVVQKWPYREMKDGNWFPVQFYSPYLTDLFHRISTGKLFDVNQLGMIAKLDSSYRPARREFKTSSQPDRFGRRALWHFKSDVTKSMRAKTDTAIVSKTSQEKADLVWRKRSRLLLPVKVQTNLARVIAVRLDEPTLGSYWVTVKFRNHNENVLEKAICLWLNSTLGIISMLGIRTPKKPCYPDFSVHGQNSISVPHLPIEKIEYFASVFDEYSDTVLGKWRDADDNGRRHLDDVISQTLEVSPEVVATARRELSREPMCTNQRYNN